MSHMWSRLTFVIDREARRWKLWAPVFWLVVAVIWIAQAIDSLLTDDPTWLHVLAISTLVVATPFTTFWVAVLSKNRRLAR
jgi:hypothetical protein